MALRKSVTDCGLRAFVVAELHNRGVAAGGRVMEDRTWPFLGVLAAD